ncbi:MAG: thiamine-phosphate kinase [Rhodobacteraceae bacterium]|nr:thiamine-phosphate kinase [Paracoccaceae bacterium]
MAAERPHEFELIKRYFAPLATDAGSLELKDDAAVYTPLEGNELVLTKDMLAADVHFFESDPPEAVAAKALRVNLSDLAAKGATARSYLLGLALPHDWSPSWVERFASGLKGDQSAFDVTLVGGDTIHSGKNLMVSITAIGETRKGAAVRRNGARPGDLLYVTGTIGDAAAGLKERLEPGFAAKYCLSEEETRHILDRYLLPQPRVKIAEVVRRYASAAMDISDGLISDAGHMARASGCQLSFRLEDIPFSSALKTLRLASRDTFLKCLNGGDDYEILVAVPRNVSSAFEAVARKTGCQISAIGEVSAGDASVILSDNGTDISAATIPGFQHF